MKLRKKANELKTEGIRFPQPEDTKYGAYRQTLYDIVYENLGYNVAKSLDFDPDTQLFYLTLASSERALCHRERADFGNGADFLLSVENTEEINPAVAIRPQIEQLVEKQEALRKQRQLLQILYTHHLEKTCPSDT